MSEEQEHFVNASREVFCASNANGVKFLCNDIWGHNEQKWASLNLLTSTNKAPLFEFPQPCPSWLSVGDNDTMKPNFHRSQIIAKTSLTLDLWHKRWCPLLPNINQNPGFCEQITSATMIGLNKIRTYQDLASEALHNWDSYISNPQELHPL